VRWLLSKQNGSGRWKNECAYNGKTWEDFEKQGQPSKWLTLRACRVLKLVYEETSVSSAEEPAGWPAGRS
jgi:hypothetical protein